MRIVVPRLNRPHIRYEPLVSHAPDHRRVDLEYRLQLR